VALGLVVVDITILDSTVSRCVFETPGLRNAGSSKRRVFETPG